MTLAPLGFDFPLMSPLSTRPPHAVPREEMLIELDEELNARAHSYPLLVAQRRMKEEEARRHIAVLAAVRDDLADPAAPAGRDGFPWDAKVRELRRELAIRRNAWPQAIRARRLGAAEAARRMERLEAVHFAYFVDLDHADDASFPGSPPPHRLPCDARFGALRAHHWRVWQWERAALAAGHPAARAYMRPFYARIDAGEPVAAGLWNHFRHCAERMGFIEQEKAA